MITQEVRLDMQIVSHDLLVHFMEHKGFTVSTMADAVAIQLKKKRSKARICRATIGHLRNAGDTGRKTCHPDVARAIEDVLDVPRDSLFKPRMSTVSRERNRAA